MLAFPNCSSSVCHAKQIDVPEECSCPLHLPYSSAEHRDTKLYEDKEIRGMQLTKLE